MTEAKTYPLRLAKEIKGLFLMMLTIFTVVGLLIIFGKMNSRGSSPPPEIGAFWIGLVAFFWYRVLSLPNKIVHYPDDRLEFHSFVKKVSVQIRDIQIIEPVRHQFGFFNIRHSDGKITVLIHFDGFHELLTNIKVKNPNVQLLGC